MCVNVRLSTSRFISRLATVERPRLACDNLNNFLQLSVSLALVWTFEVSGSFLDILRDYANAHTWDELMDGEDRPACQFIDGTLQLIHSARWWGEEQDTRVAGGTTVDGKNVWNIILQVATKDFNACGFSDPEFESFYVCCSLRKLLSRLITRSFSSSANKNHVSFISLYLTSTEAIREPLKTPKSGIKNS